MNIVFMGTPAFAVPSLEKIAASRYPISLVVTSLDKPREGPRSLPEPTPVKRAALKLDIPVLEIDDLKSDLFYDSLKAAAPDVIVVVAFRILPPDVFAIPAKGVFNLHASLLPKYRGAAPINWAIINGETETGVTTFFLQEKVDTGNMLLQKRIDIAPDENATELATKLSALGADAVVETLQLIDAGNITLTKQDDSLATKAPKIFKENSRIDWTKPAAHVHNFIRGLAERPTAWTTLGGKQVKIFQSQVLNSNPSTLENTGEAGRWQVENGKLFIDCGAEMLEILSIQIEGKKRIAAEEFLRGYRAIGTEIFV
jgi:methionyl-tRNA formyltransferase